MIDKLPTLCQHAPMQLFSHAAALCKVAFALIIANLFIVSCGPDLNAIPEVTPKMAMDMGTTQLQLQNGRSIYMAHCNKCHERVPPAKIDPEAWREVLPHMSQNAHLNSTQLADLQIYLIAAHGTVYELDLEH
jgi:cbb3-type cytochrome oxidase cytochrome c subunit